jgi:hypothetical protein
MDTEQKQPQLDPKTELPTPHDMLLSPETIHGKHRSKWLLVGICLVVGLLIGGAIIGGISLQSQRNVPAAVSPNISSTVSPIETKQATVPLKEYTNAEHGFSFTYPADWIVQEEPISSVLRKTTIHNVVSILPNDASEGKTYNNPLIQLHYYPNSRLLTIEEFNKKYLTETVAGDPVSIWAPSYEQVTNPHGIKAFYDKEHYCVAVCKIYVWSHGDKIYELKNFPDTAMHYPAVENQDEVFQNIFSSFAMKDQKPTTPPQTAPSRTLNPNPSETVYCTADALECPDGSFVSRQGPKCEFAPCPPSN